MTSNTFKHIERWQVIGLLGRHCLILRELSIGSVWQSLETRLKGWQAPAFEDFYILCYKI